VQGSTSQLNGSNNLTQVTSPASQPTMAHETHPTLFPSMLPLSCQMTHQPDQYPTGSVECSQALMPSAINWLNLLTKWMIGALPLTSSGTKSTMKNIRKSMQKSTGSSWTPLLLSKIMPYVNNTSKHPGVLKVLLTSKGWAPSPPMPSGAHTSPMMKMMKTKSVSDVITVGIDSEGEVMKQQSRLSQEDD
jgi:hypothetical protein